MLPLHCPAGCCAGCHAPCSSHALRSGSSCVLHIASFIHSSFHSLHHARFTVLFMSFLYLISTSSNQQIFKSISLGSIHSFFAPSFQPCAVHPLPMFLMLAGRPPPALRGFLAQSHANASMPQKPLHCAPITA